MHGARGSSQKIVGVFLYAKEGHTPGRRARQIRVRRSASAVEQMRDGRVFTRNVDSVNEEKQGARLRWRRNETNVDVRTHGESIDAQRIQTRKKERVR